MRGMVVGEGGRSSGVLLYLHIISANSVTNLVAKKEHTVLA